MKRSAPLSRSRQSLTRRTGVKRANRKRKASEWKRAYRSKEFVLWIKTQPCAVRDEMCNPESEAAHIKTGGMGRKSSADHIIPLCAFHHWSLHWHGKNTFERLHGQTLADLAKQTQIAWQPSAGRTGETK